MAIVSCPECSKKLKVADTSVGKKVKCSCGNIFVAEGGGAAPAKTAPTPAAGADKVMVACTECGAKLKVAGTSIGKKMKCPKCAGVFVAATEAPPPQPKKPELVDYDDVDAPAPVKKAKAVSDDDMDDLFSFAQSDAGSGGAVAKEADEPPPEADDFSAPKKAKKKSYDEDDDDFPKPKPAKKRKHRDNDEDDSEAGDDGAEIEKPVYPKRTLLNLFVFFLLFVFIAAFVVLFFQVVSGPPAGEWTVLLLEIPAAKAPVNKKPKIFGESDEEKKKKQDEANKKDTDNLKGTWVIQSADSKDKKLKGFNQRTLVFAGDKATLWTGEETVFNLDALADPKQITFVRAAKKFPIDGVYHLDGDDLKVCVNETERKGGLEMPLARPTKLDSNEGILIVLKREKTQDKPGPEIKKDDKPRPPEPKELAAHAQLQVLTQAVQAYALKNDGMYPVHLQVLLEKNENGGPYLQKADALIDPLGVAYQYNPAGDRNKGRHPDIFTFNPDRQVIGNWPATSAK